MTERTIRMLAKRLAGEFYEQKRSGKFRSMDAMCRAKVMIQDREGNMVEVVRVMPFRQAYPTSLHYSNAHWPLFVDSARRCLTTMLALPDSRISPQMKEDIYSALLEDKEKRDRHPTEGRKLLQL